MEPSALSQPLLASAGLCLDSLGPRPLSMDPSSVRGLHVVEKWAVSFEMSALAFQGEGVILFPSSCYQKFFLIPNRGKRGTERRNQMYKVLGVGYKNVSRH